MGYTVIVVALFIYHGESTECRIAAIQEWHKMNLLLLIIYSTALYINRGKCILRVSVGNELSWAFVKPPCKALVDYRLCFTKLSGFNCLHTGRSSQWIRGKVANWENTVSVSVHCTFEICCVSSVSKKYTTVACSVFCSNSRLFFTNAREFLLLLARHCMPHK